PRAAYGPSVALIRALRHWPEQVLVDGRTSWMAYLQATTRDTVCRKRKIASARQTFTPKMISGLSATSPLIWECAGKASGRLTRLKTASVTATEEITTTWGRASVSPGRRKRRTLSLERLRADRVTSSSGAATAFTTTECSSRSFRKAA